MVFGSPQMRRPLHDASKVRAPSTGLATVSNSVGLPFLFYGGRSGLQSLIFRNVAKSALGSWSTVAGPVNFVSITDSILNAEEKIV